MQSVGLSHMIHLTYIVYHISYAMYDTVYLIYLMCVEPDGAECWCAGAGLSSGGDASRDEPACRGRGTLKLEVVIVMVMVMVMVMFGTSVIMR